MPKGYPKRTTGPAQGSVVSLYKPGVPDETPDEELVEEKVEKEREIIVRRRDMVKVLEPKVVDPMKLRAAVPTTTVAGTSDVAIATKSCKKFIGRWIVLVAGKQVVATKEAIEILRAGGYVE